MKLAALNIAKSPDSEYYAIINEPTAKVSTMNNAQIRLSIKENWMAIDPAIEWTSLNMARLNATVMDAEKAMKMLRETHPGMSRLEAWSEIRAEFLTAP